MPHPYRLAGPSLEIVARAQSLAADVLRRHAADVDQRGRFPEESVAALAAGGDLGLCLAADHGGLGEGPRTFAGVVEELAGACASTAMVFVMHTSAAQAIAAAPALQGQAALLREIGAGRHLTTLALSEKGSRSRFWAPVSKLTEKGPGFVTSALKSWVTSASRAHTYVASAQRPGAASPLESTLYLVHRGAPGVRGGGEFDGLGLRGNDSAPVVLEEVAVAAGDLLTAQGKGAEAMLEVILPWFAVGTAAMANGLCRAAVSATAAHLASAGFEDTGSKLRDLPTARARLAEMAMRSEQARATLGRALDEIEAGSAEAPLHVLIARMASLEAALAVTDLAMKACGGAAFSRQLPVERLFRDARAGWVMAPTVDHLADFVGRALTGLPLFDPPPAGPLR
jgi:alkylation response protein AidB-like acyl-CoA dehydrogenase